LQGCERKNTVQWAQKRQDSNAFLPYSAAKD
jgi:hypothetical protein